MATATVEETKIPEKMFYRINEASRITWLKPYVLRYWETEFKQLKPEKDAGDQRRYRQKDIDLILEIKHLLYEEKFTIAGAREKLKANHKANIVAITPKRKDTAKKVRHINRTISSIRKDLTKMLATLNVDWSSIGA